MATLIPVINPLIFRKIGSNTIDSRDIELTYNKGVYAVNYYQDWLINTEISIQITTDVPSPTFVDYEVFLDNSSVAGGSFTDITPAGWVSGEYIYKFSYTPTVAGIYYFTIYDGNTFQSNKITVRENNNDIIVYSYNHYENNYGFVFDNDYNMCIGGLVREGQGITEINQYTASTYKPEIIDVRGTPGVDLIMSPVHNKHYNQVNKQLSCSDVTIAGVSYSRTENTEYALITERNDMVTITSKMLLNDEDDGNFYKY